jgi:hypothetical protein
MFCVTLTFILLRPNCRWGRKIAEISILVNRNFLRVPSKAKNASFFLNCNAKRLYLADKKADGKLREKTQAEHPVE